VKPDVVKVGKKSKGLGNALILKFEKDAHKKGGAPISNLPTQWGMAVTEKTGEASRNAGRGDDREIDLLLRRGDRSIVPRAEN